MITSEYRANRAKLPAEELITHRGKWAAFSPDGTKVVASELTLELLESKLEEMEVDAQLVAFEYVPGPGDSDSWLGASEWQ